VSDADAVADCVRAHVAWFTALAMSTGGRVWTDGPLTWAWVPSERTVHALFPEDVPDEVIARGLADARHVRARSVAVWSAVDRTRPELLAAGFEEGWQPWWMTAPTADLVRPTDTTRVFLTSSTGKDDAGSGPLLGHGHTWRAEARVDDRYAGRAWIHVEGDLAGLFDMEVWPRFQRRGLGTALVRLLGATAREHGAERVALNATEEGAELYQTVGFVRAGEGRTWWRHRP
jgi:GNAT superfamily N-acetyltransferase